jgi:hypothetical protein
MGRVSLCSSSPCSCSPRLVDAVGENHSSPFGRSRVVRTLATYPQDGHSYAISPCSCTTGAIRKISFIAALQRGQAIVLPLFLDSSDTTRAVPAILIPRQRPAGLVVAALGAAAVKRWPHAKITQRCVVGATDILAAASGGAALMPIKPRSRIADLAAVTLAAAQRHPAFHAASGKPPRPATCRA